MLTQVQRDSAITCLKNTAYILQQRAAYQEQWLLTTGTLGLFKYEHPDDIKQLVVRIYKKIRELMT